MVIVEKLAAELEIKLASELFNALSDACALKFYILIITESGLKHNGSPQYLIEVIINLKTAF